MKILKKIIRNKTLLSIFLIIVNFNVFADSILEVEEMKIGLLLPNLEDQFFKEIKLGAKERSNQSNLDLEVLDSKDSFVKELDQIKYFVDSGKDLIIIAPVDSHAVSRGVLLALESDVKVITVDRESVKGDIESHIGSNNMLGGVLAGNYLLDSIGKGAVIVELQGNYETTTSEERSLGFNQTVAGKLELVIRKNGMFKKEESYKIIKRLLKEEQDIDGIFAHNDEAALGAIKAIREANRNIKVVGFNGTPEAIEAILKNQMSATIKQNPYEMGYLSVETAIKTLRSEWVNKNIYVDIELIDKKNLTN